LKAVAKFDGEKMWYLCSVQLLATTDCNISLTDIHT
jgi:hypothetical protein